MKLSKKTITFLEERTDDNGYMTIAPTNLAAKGPAIVMRFLDEEINGEGETRGPCIMLDVSLNECEISGMHIYGIFEKEKKNDQGRNRK